MRDLTQGPEGRTIIRFAIPMLVGNVFQQLYTTVDGIVVGQGVGKAGLAAVGASFPVIFFMISLVFGVTMGAGIMIAQFYGARDTESLRKTVDSALIFLFWAAIAASLLGIALSGPILRAVRTPEDVFPLALGYLRIMFAGMLFMFGYNVISAVLRGLGDSTRPLYFLMIASVVNIVLDLLFVLVLHWGVAGAAWATVIAQSVSFLIGAVYIRRSPYEFLHIRVRSLRFDRRIFRTVVRLGLPTGVQQSLVSLGFIALTRIVNPFGTTVIAAYTAASRLDSFAAMPAMNLAMAVSTFTGQNLGARKAERVKKGYLFTLLVSACLALATTALFVLLGPTLIRIFSTDREVIRIGSEYLVIVSAFYILFTSMFVTGGVLRGAGATFAQMVITLLALWVVRIPVSALLCGPLGTRGIWWGIPAGWVVGLAANLVYYASGRWKSKVVVGARGTPGRRGSPEGEEALPTS